MVPFGGACGGGARKTKNINIKKNLTSKMTDEFGGPGGGGAGQCGENTYGGDCAEEN